MCDYKRVMVVAPDFDEAVKHQKLDYLPEIDTLQQIGFRVTILQGHVTVDRLYNMAQNVQCDIIHFATGQMGDDKLLLSGGEMLDAHGLLQVVRMTEATCVFINACQSIYLAQVLVDNGIPVVISTTRPVLDARAKRTSQAFYTMLMKSNDLHAAYVASKGDDGLYAWTSNGGYTEILLKPLMQKLEGFQGELRNNAIENMDAHAALQQKVEALSSDVQSAKVLKRFFIQVVGVSWGLVAILILAIMVLERASR